MTILIVTLLLCVATWAFVVQHRGEFRNEHQLAAKLEPDPSRPKYIVTEAGLGYRLLIDEPSTSNQSPPTA